SYKNETLAWVARAAKLFKVFHVHSWYDVKDNLSFAQVKIYDLDHTDPTSEASLIQACVTAEDGQCRYTREIYPPEEGQTGGKFQDNNLVPIPLQIFNLGNQTVYHGGIVSPATSGGAIGAPKLNATVRVWWETVIVNQTIYYGWEYNGTGRWRDPGALGKNASQFVGPLSMAMNNTVTVSATRTGIWVDSPVTANFTAVANVINATVFYAKFCVQDADMKIQHPEVGDKLVEAPVSINLKTSGDRAYYLTKNLLTTDNGGCTNEPHKYRGYLSDYRTFARFPNATMGDWVWRGKDAWISSFREKFGDHVWLNVSLAYLPGDADNYRDIPEGPNLKDVESPRWIGSEDVEESDYFNGNWSMLVVDVSYANTLTLDDDKEYDGFDVVVKWKGGARNNYPGVEKIVDVLRVENPYSISIIEDTWIDASVERDYNKIWVSVDECEKLELRGGLPGGTEGTVDTVPDFKGTLEILNYSEIVIKYDGESWPLDINVSRTGGDNLTVNIIETATVPDYYRKANKTIVDETSDFALKIHDGFEAASFSFLGEAGWVDVNADGEIDYTSVSDIVFYASPVAEIEIWPAQPGTEEVRILITLLHGAVGIFAPGSTAFIDAPAVLLVQGPVSALSITPLNKSVIPLTDYDKDEGRLIPAILGNDEYEFGGYDDFAIYREGYVFVTANVHDIDFYVTDNLGNPLPSGDTEVFLILPNGEEVARTPAPPELADQLIGSLAWSYKWFGEGHVVYFQLPGAEGPYGIRVLYHGSEVYYERDEIDILYETEFIEIVVRVFKVKLIFEDCKGNLIPNLWFEFTLPNGHRDWDHTTDEGEYDFPYLAGGTLTIHHAWWKGVKVPLMEARDATGEEIPLTNGELVLDIEEGIDAPITIKIPIKDLIFYTTNFQGDYKIPRLNITLTWIGTYKPWTDEKIYFLETLDPTGDEEAEHFNTSITIHPLWFRYEIDTFFHKIADDSPMEALSEYEAKYIFYQMPPAIYNIT
ncbi:hypothetical protein DRO64_08305, partial [Candidatus Bathyarchaeota archaeon]